jgi:hypothetical protein
MPLSNLLKIRLITGITPQSQINNALVHVTCTCRARFKRSVARNKVAAQLNAKPARALAPRNPIVGKSPFEAVLVKKIHFPSTTSIELITRIKSERRP